MGEDRTGLKDEVQRRLGGQGTPAHGVGLGAAVHLTAAQTQAAQAESRGRWTQAIASRLEVHLLPEADRSDETIAERALQVLFSAAPLRRERIAMSIAHGRVTLSGTVATEVERMAAEQLVADLEGVADVINLVTVVRHGRATEAASGVAEAYGGDAESGDVAGRIEALFVRQAGLRALEIIITAADGKVILSGRVQSWRERDLAERIAWAAPGVTEVLDRIVVG
jgi:osmotically-inducible protein OsmY